MGKTIFILIFFIVQIFIFVVYKRKVSALSKALVNKENEIALLNKEYYEKLENEIQIYKSQNKSNFEESKLFYMKETISNIAHQWRQPLSAISLVATSIKMYEERGMSQASEIVENCTIINENVQYLSQTLDCFNDFANKPYKRRVSNIKHVVEKLLNLTSTYTSLENIEIIYYIEKEVAFFGYKNDLVQVLLNILNNSREAFEAKNIKEKYIFIKVNSDNKYIYIDIKDTAGGIDEEVLPRIFEPYFTTKHKTLGTGLGLYLTYDILTNKLKGEITAKNTNYTFSNNGKNYTCAQFIVKVPIKI